MNTILESLLFIVCGFVIGYGLNKLERFVFRKKRNGKDNN